MRSDDRPRRGRAAPADGGKPVPLAAALDVVMRQTGIGDRLAQNRVLESWERLVGSEVASVSRPVSIADDGTLFAVARSASWVAELSMLEREILSALNRETGRLPIKRIRWSLMR